MSDAAPSDRRRRRRQQSSDELSSNPDPAAPPAVSTTAPPAPPSTIVSSSPDRSPTRLDTADGVTYNFKSTLDWRGAPGVGATEPASASEQLLWLCLAFGVRCDAGPAPPPPPPPVPLSDECKAEIRAVCAVAPAACGSCVHHHSGELIAHGCPRKGVPGAAEACIEYCESEGEVRRGAGNWM